MKALIIQLLAGLYLKLRGATKIVTRPTGFNYSHTEVVEPKDATDLVKKVRLRSYQFAHLISYAKWYIPDRVRYTYEVEITLEEEGRVKKQFPRLHYPHLCAKFLYRTRYPHVCAINACLDRLIELNLDVVDAYEK